MTCCGSMGRSTTNVNDAALLAAAPRLARALRNLYNRIGTEPDAETDREVASLLSVAGAAGVLTQPEGEKRLA